MADDGMSTGAKVGVGAGVAGLTAAELYTRMQANKRLGPGFVSDTRSLLSASDRTRLDSAPKTLDVGRSGNLRAYTDYDSRVLNEYARTGRVTEVQGNKRALVSDPARAQSLAGRYEAILDKANEGLRSNTLPQNLKLFRATGTSAIGNIKPGDILRDKAIQSASTSLDAAGEFYEHARQAGKKPLMMVIDAGGKKGMSLEALSHFAYEKEVALPGGTEYRVDRIEKGVRRSLFQPKRDYAFVSIGAQGEQTASNVSRIAPTNRFAGALSKAAKFALPVAVGAAALAAFSQSSKAGETAGQATAHAAAAAGDVATGGAVGVYKDARAGGDNMALAGAKSVATAVDSVATLGLLGTMVRDKNVQAEVARQRQTPRGARGSAPINQPNFNAADKTFNAKRDAAAPQADQQGDGQRKGWSNAARIGAAKARGAKNLPYNGNPDAGSSIQ